MSKEQLFGYEHLRCMCPETGEVGFFLASHNGKGEMVKRLTPLFNKPIELHEHIRNQKWPRVEKGNIRPYIIDKKMSKDEVD